MLRPPPSSPLFPYTTLFRSRLARLADAPFIKVEATKFTEVGYVGRDVDSIIRDLADIAVKQTREAEMRKRSEEHTSELQSRGHLVCRLLLEKKKESEKIQRH